MRVGGKDLHRWRRTSKDVLSSCIDPWVPPQAVVDRLRLLFAKWTQGVYGREGVVSRNFQQWNVATSKLVVEASILAAVSASSLPGIPLCPGIHRNVIGPGRALRSDLK